MFATSVMMKIRHALYVHAHLMCTFTGDNWLSEAYFGTFVGVTNQSSALSGGKTNANHCSQKVSESAVEKEREIKFQNSRFFNFTSLT